MTTSNQAPEGVTAEARESLWNTYNHALSNTNLLLTDPDRWREKVLARRQSIEFAVRAEEQARLAVLIEAAREEIECDLCEEQTPGFRWYAKDGSPMTLCEDCHGKSFAYLWDHFHDDGCAICKDEMVSDVLGVEA